LVLMDTTFLIDIMRARSRALDALEVLDAEREPVAVTTVTLQEMARGLATTDLTPARRTELLELAAARTVLPLDRHSARRAGEVDAALWAAGTPLDPEDAAIAGIALSHDEVLLTRREDIFGRVDGLRLRVY